MDVALAAQLAQKETDLNSVSEDEHIPKIEQYIRRVKERARATLNSLPFNKLSTRITVQMIQGCVMWLNSFPANDGISDTHSPRTIVTGKQINYKQHCRIEFRAYAQIHGDHDNTMATRTTGAIVLRPTGNAQGGHFFFSLTIGRRVDRHRWTELPMPT